jgi:hypothetical protein
MFGGASTSDAGVADDIFLAPFGLDWTGLDPHYSVLVRGKRSVQDSHKV